MGRAFREPRSLCHTATHPRKLKPFVSELSALVGIYDVRQTLHFVRVS